MNFITHKIPTSQHTLHVETLGNPNDPACVLIPGAMQGTWGWSDHFCETIANKRFYAIRFDHRDIGLSTCTPKDQDYDLEDLAQDILSILKALNISKAHFAGHSMGGHLCRQLAVFHPETVLSICPISSGPLGATVETEKPLTKEEKKTLAKTWEVFLARKDSEDPEKHFQGFLKVYAYLNGTIPLDPAFAREYITKMIQTSPKHTLQPGNHHERVMKHFGETLNERKGILKKISIPTLIIHGDHDPIALPRHARSMVNEIPNARIALIEGMGHMFLNRELENRISSLLIKHMQSLKPPLS